jgi:hypothetical protein
MDAGRASRLVHVGLQNRQTGSSNGPARHVKTRFDITRIGQTGRSGNCWLETYCKDVTPGEGRILACLYAHSDKLSGKCEFALYDAAAQLERAVAALSYVVNECADDLDQFCRDVAAGEGRLLMCLDKNDQKVSDCPRINDK